MTQKNPELYLLLQRPTQEDLQAGPTGLLWYENGHPAYKVSLVYRNQYVPMLVQQENPGLQWGDDGTAGQAMKATEQQLAEMEANLKQLEEERKAAVDASDWGTVETLDAKTRLARARFAQMKEMLEKSKKAANDDNSNHQKAEKNDNRQRPKKPSRKHH